MRAGSSDRYTRLVGLLKVLFPLIALGLLSTLFLLSRSVDPETQIPFADTEIQERLRDQQITAPFFSGTTVNGDEISFSAAKVTTPDGSTGGNMALDARAELTLVDGTVITVDANETTFDIAADRVELTGDVVFETSAGYVLKTDRITAAMSSLNVTSPGAVSGTAPDGTLNAGAMTLSKPDADGAAQLIFTNGVTMVYSPKRMKE